MRCSDVEALWDELRGGNEAQDKRALAHLRLCKDCQDTYEQFEGVAYCLTCLPVVEPPAHLVPRILQHVQSLRRRFRSIEPDSFAHVGSPVGELTIAWRDTRITFVGIARHGEDAELSRSNVERRLRRPAHPAELPAWVAEAVGGFFRTWQIDLSHVDISELSDFEQAALRKAAQIPPGEVRSYGWIAKEIGHPQAARAVGQAMARNPVVIFFPCHRVVDASGSLHNYGYGVEMKARLLQLEGYENTRG